MPFPCSGTENLFGRGINRTPTNWPLQNPRASFCLCSVPSSSPHACSHSPFPYPILARWCAPKPRQRAHGLLVPLLLVSFQDNTLLALHRNTPGMPKSVTHPAMSSLYTIITTISIDVALCAPMFIEPATTLICAPNHNIHFSIDFPIEVCKTSISPAPGYEYHPGPAEHPLVWRSELGFVESMDTRLVKSISARPDVVWACLCA